MIRVALLILFGLWGAFYSYWFIAARSAKRNVRSNRVHAAYRALLFLIILAVFNRLRAARQLERFRQFARPMPHSALVICGLIVCALGLSFAVWARKYLGRNWGMPMSVKEDPELVTTGPYRYVRHPIYSGILLAVLGSALVGGGIWLVLFIFFGIYLAIAGIYLAIAARAEERLMLRQFPSEYPAYRAGTKAIVPFVW